MRKPVNVDLWAGLFTLTVTALFWSQLLDRDEFSMHSLYYPDKVLPVLLAMGVAILAKGLVRPTLKVDFCKELNGDMAYTAAVSMAWVLSMDHLGFILSSVLAMGLMFRRFQPDELRTPREWGKLLAVVAGELAFMWVVFHEFLSVSLPTGRILSLLETAAE